MKVDKKRQEILQASARVFRQKGFNGARIQDIADELGMQKGSLYYYIDTKEDLLKGLVEDIIQQCNQAIESIVNTKFTASQKLYMCMESHLRLFHQNIDAFGIFMQEDLQLINNSSEQDIFIMIKNYEKQWIRILDEGVKTNEFILENDKNVILLSIFGMMNWSYRWYKKSMKLPIQEIARIQYEMVLNGIKLKK